MKFVALVSGGKDSIYSILECQRHGHELVACVHLGEPEVHQEESYMYQTAASETLQILVEECIRVPLVLFQRTGRSLNTSLVYVETNAQDEVEDLYQALAISKKRFPEIQAVASGAILSTYQRTRIENVCSRLGLTSLSYLWRSGSQHEVLQRMLDDGLEAVVVRTAAPPGLLPRRHLNRTLRELHPHFLRLHEKYQFHVCGEGGEYESLVLDCPLFRSRLVLDQVEIHETDDEVGVLRIIKCHSEAKDDLKQNCDDKCCSLVPAAQPTNIHAERPDHYLLEKANPSSLFYLPNTKHVSGGLWHTAELLAPMPAKTGESEAANAVEEALQIFSILSKTLRHFGCEPQDVMMVHVYLSEISLFASINEHYRNFFGIFLPPSRSCIAVGALPGGRRIMLDCLVQCGSGKFMRTLPTDLDFDTDPILTAAHANISSSLRKVLHVQSISHWAPVCVGPYSQTNTFRSSLHFIAGQIGLIPSSMALRQTWKEQLRQAWTNAAAVLDALDGCSLADIMSGMVYVSDQIAAANDAIDSVASISFQSIEMNGGVRRGVVDGLTAVQLVEHGGYEDEETMIALSGRPQEHEVASCPLLVVAISEMPVGALAEVEVIAASRSAASCLETSEFSSQRNVNVGASEASASLWDTGYELYHQEASIPSLTMDVSWRCFKKAVAGFGVVTCQMPESSSNVLYNTKNILEKMLESLLTCEASPPKRSCLHLRLYCLVPCLTNSGALSDVVDLRNSFGMAVGRAFDECPTYTIIPTRQIRLVSRGKACSPSCIFAIQALAVDPIDLETNKWIREGRAES